MSNSEASPSPESIAFREAAERARRGRRALVFGIVTNAFLAAAKIAGGVVTRSQALIADGIESGMDVVTSAMLWVALKYAERPPDEDHPYGHGKAESLAGVFGALLLAVAGLAVAASSLGRILAAAAPDAPLPETPSAWALLVLIGVILIKEGLFRYVGKQARLSESSVMLSEAWHHRSDALTSIAAFLGISIALIGGPAWILADAWAALFCCLIILFNATLIFRGSIGEVMDARHSKELVSRLTSASLQVPGVLSAEKCRVRKSGLSLIADIHVRVDGDTTVRVGHDISHQVKDLLMQLDRRIADVTVHIEPGETPDQGSSPKMPIFRNLS